MKKNISLFVAVTLILSLFSAVAADNEYSENIVSTFQTNSSTFDYPLKDYDPNYLSDEAFFGVWSEGQGEWLSKPVWAYSKWPGLASVEAAAKVGNYEGAKEEFLAYYRTLQYDRIETVDSLTTSMLVRSELLEKNFYAVSALNGFPLQIFNVNNEWQNINLDVTANIRSSAGVQTYRSYMINTIDKQNSDVEFMSRQSQHPPTLTLVVNGLTRVINPIADSYISAGTNSKMNFGKEEILLSQESGIFRQHDENAKRPYLLFDISWLRSNDVISSAVLTVRGRNAGGTGEREMLLYRWDESTWTEDNITWDFFTEHLTFSCNDMESWDYITSNNPTIKGKICFFHRGNELRIPASTFAYTKNERYAYTFLRQQMALMHSVGFNTNVMNELDMSTHLYETTRSIFWVLDSEYMTPEIFTALVKYKFIFAKWLVDDYYGVATNNYATYATQGVYRFMSCFQEIANFDYWMERTIDENTRMDEGAFYEDGTCVELSDNYIAVFINNYLSPALISANTGIQLPYSISITENIEKGLLAYMYGTAPGFRGFNVGDSYDYGSGTPRAVSQISRWYEAYFPNNRVLEFAATQGKSGSPPDFTSISFPIGLRTIMRSDWTENALSLLFTGKMDGSHGHADATSIAMYAYGRSLLVDPGYGSLQVGDLLSYMRSSQQHNMVTMNDRSYVNISGITSGLDGECKISEINGLYDFVTYTSRITFDAQEHERSVLFLKDAKFWIVSDYLSPLNKTQPQTYQQHWHMMPNANMTLDEYTKAVRSNFDDVNVQVVPVDRGDFSNIAFEDTIFSPTSGSIINSKKLVYHKEKTGDTLFDAIIVPENIGEEFTIAASPIDSGLPEGTANSFSFVVNDDANQTYKKYYFYKLNDLSQTQITTLDNYSTDADTILIEEDEQGNFVSAFLTNASYLKNSALDNEYLFKNNETVNAIAFSFKKDTLHIDSSEFSKEDLDSMTFYAPTVSTVAFGNALVETRKHKDYVYFGDTPLVDAHLTVYQNQASYQHLVGVYNNANGTKIGQILEKDKFGVSGLTHVYFEPEVFNDMQDSISLVKQHEFQLFMPDLSNNKAHVLSFYAKPDQQQGDNMLYIDIYGTAVNSENGSTNNNAKLFSFSLIKNDFALKSTLSKIDAVFYNENGIYKCDLYLDGIKKETVALDGSYNSFTDLNKVLIYISTAQNQSSVDANYYISNRFLSKSLSVKPAQYPLSTDEVAGVTYPLIRYAGDETFEIPETLTVQEFFDGEDSNVLLMNEFGNVWNGCFENAKYELAVGKYVYFNGRYIMLSTKNDTDVLISDSFENTTITNSDGTNCIINNTFDLRRLMPVLNPAETGGKTSEFLLMNISNNDGSPYIVLPRNSAINPSGNYPITIEFSIHTSDIDASLEFLFCTGDTMSSSISGTVFDRMYLTTDSTKHSAPSLRTYYIAHDEWNRVAVTIYPLTNRYDATVNGVTYSKTLDGDNKFKRFITPIRLIIPNSITEIELGIDDFRVSEGYTGGLEYSIPDIQLISNIQDVNIEGRNIYRESSVSDSELLSIVPEGYSGSITSAGKLAIWQDGGIIPQYYDIHNYTIPKIKNVIYMMPGGGGFALFDFANAVKQQGGFNEGLYPNATQVEQGPMFMKDYLIGTVTTHSENSSVTDSAAAGTALSTGYRTNNGFVGTDSDRIPYATILEAAQLVGKRTGSVTTCHWTHETPSAFMAHTDSKDNFSIIAEQIINQGTDVVLGSGFGNWGSVSEATDRGYTIINNKSELASVVAGTKIWGNIVNDCFPDDIDLTSTQPTLAEMTSAAINTLDYDENGFFLMVEGSGIKSGGSDNDLVRTTSEFLAFDEAFKVAVEYAQSRNDTIVIAVTNHDTGGLILPNADFVGGNTNSADYDEAVADVRAGINSNRLSWETNGQTDRRGGVWIYAPYGLTYPQGLSNIIGDTSTNRNLTTDIIDIAPYLSELMGVNLDYATNHLFVDVTSEGTYDMETNTFTFSDSEILIKANQSALYVEGEPVSLDGKIAVYLNNRFYVPRELITMLPIKIKTSTARYFDDLTGRVLVKGQVDKSLAGEYATMILFEKDEEDVTVDNVGYIDQIVINGDGSYVFKFLFNGDIIDYKLRMYLGNELITDSVTVATASYSWLDTVMQVYEKENHAVKSKAVIKNHNDIEGLTYVMCLAFYDENSNLIGISKNDIQSISQEITTDEINAVMPYGTATVKSIIWSDFSHIIPLCKPLLLDLQ